MCLYAPFIVLCNVVSQSIKRDEIAVKWFVVQFYASAYRVMVARALVFIVLSTRFCLMTVYFYFDSG